MNKETEQSLNSFDPSKFQPLVRKTATVCSQDHSWDCREAQNGSEEELFLLRFDLTIAYHTQSPKQLPGISTEVTETRKHRAFRAGKAGGFSHSPPVGDQEEHETHRGSAENDSPKSTVVTNSASAFFKTLGEINPFEFHRAKCLQFRANLGICFSFTAYMTH